MRPRDRHGPADLTALHPTRLTDGAFQPVGRDFAFLGNEQFERSCHGAGEGLAEGGEEPKSLLQRLDDALKKMRDDGTLEALGEKHFKSVPAGQGTRD